MRISGTTGRLVCPCGKGYASEDKTGAHYGKCRICYLRGLTRRELKALGISSRP